MENIWKFSKNQKYIFSDLPPLKGCLRKSKLVCEETFKHSMKHSHNSQEMRETKMSINNEWKINVWHIYTRAYSHLFSHF